MKAPTLSKPKKSATDPSTPVNSPVSRSRSSWAKRMNVDQIIIPSPLSTPSTIASGRSRSWRHSHRKPSFISPFQFTRPDGAAPLADLNCPAMRNTSPAATAKVPASTKKGSAKPTPSSRLPKGGPAKELATISAPHRLPLAFSSCSGSTMAGRKV